MSVGSLAPGIKVRQKEELMKTMSRSIVIDDEETADPLIYSIEGGLFKFMKENISTFMRNEPEFNLLLSTVFVKLCSFPVKLDQLDG